MYFIISHDSDQTEFTFESDETQARNLYNANHSSIATG